MRVLLVAALSLACTSLGSTSNLTPLTFKDISLMLRSGYSSDAVEREVATRHFIGILDASAEKSLTQAGGSPVLLSKLKSGAFAVPPAEAAAVAAELAAKAQRRTAQVEESRKLDTLYQARLAQSRNAGPPNTAGQTAIAALVKGELVTSRNGVLHPHLDGEFEKKKLIALYRGAYWCPPCRKFAPQLVAFYNRIVAAHPEFEIVFVSNDKSANAMENYMRNEQMPWPALRFDQVRGNAALNKYFGESIPCLVVVDENGKVIFDTYAGKSYRGPEAVLNDLDQFFAGKGPAQVAQMH
jgi:thiol-disulfide isomerase/thioredoxin